MIYVTVTVFDGKKQDGKVSQYTHHCKMPAVPPKGSRVSFADDEGVSICWGTVEQLRFAVFPDGQTTVEIEMADKIAYYDDKYKSWREALVAAKFRREVIEYISGTPRIR